MTPADVPTPDAIRPEWEPWAEKAAKALCGQAKPPYVGAAGACPHHRTIAETVLAAVCGDIVEAAREGYVRVSAAEREVHPLDLPGWLGEDNDADTPRRPLGTRQSDERTEVVPVSTPRGFCTCKPHGPMPDCGFAEHRALARNPHGETPR